ncbi:MAG: helix-turn-helix domain-containing protein [Gammaproteobacteria bacterium]
MTALFEQLSFGWRSALMGSILLPIVVGTLLLLLKATDRSPARWLAALMAGVVLSSIPFFIGFAGAYDAWPDLTFLPVEMTLSFGPLLYIYVHSCLTGLKPGWRWWLLLPALVHFVYQLAAFTLLGGYETKWEFTLRVHDPIIEPIVWTVSLLLYAGCWYAVHKLYQNYKRWLPTMRADDDHFRPVWLNYFLTLCLVMGALWIAIIVMEFRDSYNYRARYWLVIVSLITLLVILLETLSRRHAFPKMTVEETAQPEASVEKPAQDWPALGEELRQKVLDQNWFLETDFSLATLAQRAGLNRSYISRAINDGLGENFSQFINSMRAAHARTLLRDSNMKLLDVAYQSGFGSKASFNRVFRTIEGCTPTEYRRKNVS